MQLLSRIPWFLGAPAVLVVGLVLAVGANFFGGDYFKRTFLEKENPLVATPLETATPGESPTSASTAQATSTPPPAANTPAPTATPAPSGPVVVSSGEFRDGAPGHFGSGTATLGKDASGNPVLVLSDFSVTNGPDLHVILGTSEGGGGEGLDLGELKATDGTFSYPVPSDVDLASFKSVTIFCKSFPTIFAVATLGGS